MPFRYYVKNFFKPNLTYQFSKPSFVTASATLFSLNNVYMLTKINEKSKN